MTKPTCNWCSDKPVKAVAVSETVKLPQKFQGSDTHQRVAIVRACAAHKDRLANAR